MRRGVFLLALLSSSAMLGGGAWLPSAQAAQHRASHASAHGKTAKANSKLDPAGAAAAAAKPDAPLAVAGTPPPPQLPDMASYVLMDEATGAIIAEKSPTVAWPPASLTKLMTAYLTYQSIAEGNLKLNQTVPISKEAWHTGGSRMFISPSQTVTVNDLLHGLIIDSGNDSAVALSQAVAGTQDAFVQMMNATAQKLGLSGTHYTDVDGLPNPQLRTTALDVARLSRAIIEKFPQFLKISVKKHYTWDKIKQRSWNPVLFRDPTVDGLKTGRTDEAGHCVDATSLRNGRRLIAVVLGGPSWHASTNAIEALLDYGYRFYADQTIAKVGKPVGTLSNARLKPETIPVGPAHDIVLTVPAHGAKSVKTALSLDKPSTRGIRKGDKVGTMTVMIDGKTLETTPVVALADAKPAGFVTRIVRGIKKLL